MTTLNKDNFANPGCEVYVETGLGLGDSLAYAASLRFGLLVGIEVSHERVMLCREKFRGNPRVYVWEGSSPDMLPAACYPGRKTLFWLDAHYEKVHDNSCWSPRDGQCPLLAELKVILGVPWEAPPVILIDDASCFCSNEWWYRYGKPGGHDQDDYPSFTDIFETLRGHDPRWQFSIKDEILTCRIP